MGSGEVACSSTKSARYSRRKTQWNVNLGMWKCCRNIPRNLCLKFWVLWLGRSTGKQENHGLCRKWSVELLNKGSGRISIMEKEGRTPEDWWRNWIVLDKCRKKYLESICDKFMEFQRMGHYELMDMKTKELGWKENHGIQNIDFEDSKGNIIVVKGELYYKALLST